MSRADKVCYGGGVAQSESEKAAEFNSQFTDVFTKSEYSQVPLLDRSAPFMEDRFVHELLKSKLFSYGIGGNTLKWTIAFLCYRQQRVDVNGVKSD